jgi:hypothetical protein
MLGHASTAPLLPTVIVTPSTPVPPCASLPDVTLSPSILPKRHCQSSPYYPVPAPTHSSSACYCDAHVPSFFGIPHSKKRHHGVPRNPALPLLLLLAALFVSSLYSIKFTHVFGPAGRAIRTWSDSSSSYTHGIGSRHLVGDVSAQGQDKGQAQAQAQAQQPMSVLDIVPDQDDIPVGTESAAIPAPAEISDDAQVTIIDRGKRVGPAMSVGAWKAYLANRETVTGKAGPQATLEAWDFH